MLESTENTMPCGSIENTMPLAQHVVLKIVVAQRDGSDQRWGVAVRSLKKGEGT